MRLGTSVGWSDVYPSTYYEQDVDVSGLHGCFALWMVADPYNELWESDDTDNASMVTVRLPRLAARAAAASTRRAPGSE